MLTARDLHSLKTKLDAKVGVKEHAVDTDSIRCNHDVNDYNSHIYKSTRVRRLTFE